MSTFGEIKRSVQEFNRKNHETFGVIRQHRYRTLLFYAMADESKPFDKLVFTDLFLPTATENET